MSVTRRGFLGSMLAAFTAPLIMGSSGILVPAREIIPTTSFIDAALALGARIRIYDRIMKEPNFISIVYLVARDGVKVIPMDLFLPAGARLSIERWGGQCELAVDGQLFSSISAELTDENRCIVKGYLTEGGVIAPAVRRDSFKEWAIRECGPDSYKAEGLAAYAFSEGGGKLPASLKRRSNIISSWGDDCYTAVELKGQPRKIIDASGRYA